MGGSVRRAARHLHACGAVVGHACSMVHIKFITLSCLLCRAGRRRERGYTPSGDTCAIAALSLVVPAYWQCSFELTTFALAHAGRRTNVGGAVCRAARHLHARGAVAGRGGAAAAAHLGRCRAAVRFARAGGGAGRRRAGARAQPAAVPHTGAPSSTSETGCACVTRRCSPEFVQGFPGFTLTLSDQCPT